MFSFNVQGFLYHPFSVILTVQKHYVMLRDVADWYFLSYY